MFSFYGVEIDTHVSTRGVLGCILSLGEKMKIGDLILYWSWNENVGQKTRYPAIVIDILGNTIVWYGNGRFETDHISDLVLIQ